MQPLISNSPPVTMMSEAADDDNEHMSEEEEEEEEANHEVVFPPHRIHESLRRRTGLEVDESASLYLTGVIDYITGEVLEQAGLDSNNVVRESISSIHVRRGIKKDDELKSLYKRTKHWKENNYDDRLLYTNYMDMDEIASSASEEEESASEEEEGASEDEEEEVEMKEGKFSFVYFVFIIICFINKTIP